MLRLAALFCLLLAALSCSRAPQKEAQTLSFWYWHTPFELKEGQVSDLKQLGVTDLYVRAGTFSNDGEGLVPILPQKWVRNESGFAVHLVYNADSGALKHFEDFAVDAMAKTISDRFRFDRRLATEAGVKVVGIQLDLDVPTRLLPRYADLLKTVRASIEKGDSLSITSLPTWFTSAQFAKVVAQVDFYAPQFYDTSVPQKVEELHAISDRKSLEKGIEQAEKLGRPYFAGVASFGRALLYDPDGSLQGTYLGLSPDQAMRHPSLRLDKEEQTDEERILRFRAIRAGQNGKGIGWYLVFRIPKPKAVLNSLELVQKGKLRYSRGVALFRIPELEESMAVPLPSLIAQIQGTSLAVRLKVTAEVHRDPWSRIERQTEIKEDSKVTLWIENQGPEPLQIGPEALSMTLEWEPGSALEFNKGTFDFAEPSRNGLRSSLSSANRVEAKRWSLNVGEKASLGPFVLRSGTLINYSWKVRSLSGVDSSDAGNIDSNRRNVEKETGIRSTGVR